MDAGEIGRRIRDLRKQHDKKQEEVARTSGLSGATIYRIEQGSSDPKWSQLDAIAKALEVPISALLGDSSNVFAIVRISGKPKLLSSLVDSLKDNRHVTEVVRGTIRPFPELFAFFSGPGIESLARFVLSSLRSDAAVVSKTETYVVLRVYGPDGISHPSRISFPEQPRGFVLARVSFENQDAVAKRTARLDGIAAVYATTGVWDLMYVLRSVRKDGLETSDNALLQTLRSLKTDRDITRLIGLVDGEPLDELLAKK
jgi:transcriptional regulator with XRE-family HTH domain